MTLPGLTRIAGTLLCATALLAGCGAAHSEPAKQRRAGVDLAAGLAGKIPASLLAEVRPIGRGPRFQPPLKTARPSSRCLPTLGRRYAAHIEVFGANRVVLLAAGIGTAAPRSYTDGRLTHAACFGDAVTLDPTGVVYFRPGAKVTLGTLFSAWGQELSATRVASFTGGRTTVFIGGKRWPGAAKAVRLTRGAEIVVEIGAHVPPHHEFVFPPAPSPELG